LNVHRVNDVRQAEIHTTEPLILEPNPLEVDIALAKLKKHKSVGSDQIPAEMFESGCVTLRSAILKLINTIWSMEELPEQ
jgi:hypothetical protein